MRHFHKALNVFMLSICILLMNALKAQTIWSTIRNNSNRPTRSINNQESNQSIDSNNAPNSSFYHAIGLSIYGYDAIPALMYAPRWNITELNENTTLSIGTHFGINPTFYSEYSNPYTLSDLPIMMELNFGHGSHSKNKKNSGQFIGLGYGFNETEGIISEGFVFNAGIRQKLKGKSIGLRVSYLHNIKSNGGNVFSFGLFYTFKQNNSSENKPIEHTPKKPIRNRSILEILLGI